MKSLFLVLIFGIAMANAQNIGLDFINDNIIKPMLEGIYQNAVTAVVNGIFGLLKPQGKRDIENLKLDLSNVSDLLANIVPSEILVTINSWLNNLIQNINNLIPSKSDPKNLQFIQAIINGLLQNGNKTSTF